MLITERSITTTRTQPAPRTIARRAARLEINRFLRALARLTSKAGDRQAWLLLALVMLPLIGMVRNFMTYGFER
jgi:hypothetical protein